MKVSIIIVNYNTKQLIINCLKSIFEKTNDIKYEIIIIDNCSSDGSKDEIPYLFPNIKYIYSEENLGFGRANNLGFKYSQGDYIFLLNSDTLLINNAIKELVDFMEANPFVGIAGGQLYSDKREPIHSYLLEFPFMSWELNLLLCGLPIKIKAKKKRKELSKHGFMEVAYITGADMMLRRTDIEKYGFFDPDYFLYFEESDLTYRFHKEGKIKSYFYPKAKIIHLEGQSLSASLKKELIKQNSRKLFYKKHHHSFYTFISNTIFFLSHCFNYVRYRITNRKYEAIQQKTQLKAFIKSI